MKEKIYQIALLIMLTFISLNYFYATFLPEPFKLFRLATLVIVVVLGLYYSFTSSKGFNLPVQILILSMIISVFMAYLTWDQPVYLGFLVTLPYLLWPIYFLLLKMKIEIDLLEKIILLFGLIYSIFYVYQFLNPTNIMFSFGMADGEYKETRGIIRVIFPGVGIFWLAVAISLSRFSNGDKYNYLYLLIIILGFIFPFMQATRTFIVPTIIIYVYHFSKHLSVAKKTTISILIIFSLFILPNVIGDIDIPVIQGLIDQQKKTMDDGKKDIRYIAATYYAFEFSPTFVNQILGNGIGHERAAFGQFLKHLYSKGLYIADIGIIGVYAWFGILPFIAWILIGRKIYYNEVPIKYLYLKYYFFYVYFGSITGSTFYHINIIIASVYALYIFQTVKYSKKIRLMEKLKKLNREEIEVLKKLSN